MRFRCGDRPGLGCGPRSRLRPVGLLLRHPLRLRLADLRLADLRLADLRLADLRLADLRLADLRLADLRRSGCPRGSPRGSLRVGRGRGDRDRGRDRRRRRLGRCRRGTGAAADHQRRGHSNGETDCAARTGSAVEVHPSHRRRLPASSCGPHSRRATSAGAVS
ncbi:pentapeptide repeat-containing protein [Nakamurella sp. A5-74]|uniref:Pentapeptide repeat-containing protein n=1 Tax=Nakamurella sp. A5-74 TaxID=3158264 RepID=A0AAU8DJF2_9ACTN